MTRHDFAIFGLAFLRCAARFYYISLRASDDWAFLLPSSLALHYAARTRFACHNSRRIAAFRLITGFSLYFAFRL